MEAKEKAIELVNKYLRIYDGRVIQAKQCALIAVNEIINISLPSSEYGGVITNNTIEYWEEVKQKLLNL